MADLGVALIGAGMVAGTHHRRDRRRVGCGFARGSGRERQCVRRLTAYPTYRQLEAVAVIHRWISPSW
jgi:hypothetical protein